MCLIMKILPAAGKADNRLSVCIRLVKKKVRSIKSKKKKVKKEKKRREKMKKLKK